jgi:heme/copper-type cytochrome/quinol oxidase subunit 2
LYMLPPTPAYILYKLTKGVVLMFKSLVIRKAHLVATGFILLVVLAAILFFTKKDSIVSTIAPAGQERTFQMVTTEFKTTTKDGKQIEAYRWDPGTIVVKKGEKVKLNIYGVNGETHPFLIEGLNIKGEVKKGKETVVSFTADKPGTYRIICLTHPDISHEGPMVGYIEVLD